MGGSALSIKTVPGIRITWRASHRLKRRTHPLTLVGVVGAMHPLIHRASTAFMRTDCGASIPMPRIWRIEMEIWLLSERFLLKRIIISMRKVHHIEKNQKWKSSQLKLFLFYQSVPTIINFLDSDYFIAFTGYVIAVRLLYEPIRRIEDIDLADKILNYYVEGKAAPKIAKTKEPLSFMCSI